MEIFTLFTREHRSYIDNLTELRRTAKGMSMSAGDGDSEYGCPGGVGQEGCLLCAKPKTPLITSSLEDSATSRR